MYIHPDKSNTKYATPTHYWGRYRKASKAFAKQGVLNEHTTTTCDSPLPAALRWSLAARSMANGSKLAIMYGRSTCPEILFPVATKHWSLWFTNKKLSLLFICEHRIRKLLIIMISLNIFFFSIQKNKNLVMTKIQICPLPVFKIIKFDKLRNNKAISIITFKLYIPIRSFILALLHDLGLFFLIGGIKNEINW